MSAPEQDELQPQMTEGYKVGEKKSINEYATLDAEDESLNRWKQSLGLSAGSAGTSIGEAGDKRTVVILELALEVQGHSDIVVDLTKPGALEGLSSNPITIKEGSEYRVRVKFRVQHEVISGLRFLQVVKRKGIKVDKSDEMMGSYGPNTQESPSYTKALQWEEAPAGMLARGTYAATTKFADDDKVDHLTFEWSFKIDKNWA